MDIPETDNIHFQYAFKAGYRLALEGKSAASMPSAIRRDLEMRNYFQQGWEQAEQDVKQGLAYNARTCWKCRFIWGAVMILGGAATAYSIIYSYEKEQAELMQRHQSKIDQTVTPTIQHAPSDLSILSQQAREDLLANLAEKAQQTKYLPPLTKVVDSSIKISRAILTSGLNNQQPIDEFNESVPKYIRTLTFFTEIHLDSPETLTHRWRFNHQYLKTVIFPLDNQPPAIWSTIKMSSAWQGRWDVEVLNNQQEVIYRKTFRYGVQKQ
ncbi:hypothetical protein MNBD_GAMMA04-915 [hydrothermal vent metagenome]|uniref:DUF2914 domain-containing protein n=1 Tax=hydrothermal vent metagenome TaxID=652676 RepID=A0A3B0W163_9ZZZZ